MSEPAPGRADLRRRASRPTVVPARQRRADPRRARATTGSARPSSSRDDGRSRSPRPPGGSPTRATWSATTRTTTPGCRCCPTTGSPRTSPTAQAAIVAATGIGSAPLVPMSVRGRRTTIPGCSAGSRPPATATCTGTSSSRTGSRTARARRSRPTRSRASGRTATARSCCSTPGRAARATRSCRSSPGCADSALRFVTVDELERAPVSRRPAILAVDGGGSKIDAVLAPARRNGARRRPDPGRGLRRERRRGTHEPGDRRRRRGVRRRRGRASSAFPVADLGVYCLAGADLPVDDRRIVRWLRSRRVTGEDIVRNDTFAVLRAGTDRTWGVGVVCGYGTNCSGVAPDGRITRFPSVGPISGDWGGGAEVGGAGLWYAIRAEDGRGAKTTLARLVPDALRAPPAPAGPRGPVPRTGRRGPRSPSSRPSCSAPRPTATRSRGASWTGRPTRSWRWPARRSSGSACTALDVDVVLGGGIFRNRDAAFFVTDRRGRPRGRAGRAHRRPDRRRRCSAPR